MLVQTTDQDYNNYMDNSTKEFLKHTNATLNPGIKRKLSKFNYIIFLSTHKRQKKYKNKTRSGSSY